jgi:predicted metalloprotease
MACISGLYSGWYEVEDLPQILAFLAAEEAVAARFALSPEEFLPAFFSLRFGGDWCCATGEVTAVSVVKKTTVYDEEAGYGYSREEILLLINPLVLEEEGEVWRLEKCGSEEARMRVSRPYRVRARADRIIVLTVLPHERTIRAEERESREMTFTGSEAYGLAHEMEHLLVGKVKGEPIWRFRFS